MLDLTELHERIHFARGEITLLVQQARAFTSGAIGALTLPNGSDELNIYVTQREEIPTAIKSRIGTIANELRAVLDSLACQLAMENGRSPKGVYFPIGNSQEHFEKYSLGGVKKLSLKHRKIIEELKLYPENEPLIFGLHEADKLRKHQRLACYSAQNIFSLPGIIHAEASNVEFINSRLNGTFVRRLRILGNAKTEVGKPILVASGVPVALRPQIGYTIAFEEPHVLRGKEVATALRQMANRVEGIINLFAPDAAV